MSDAPGPAGAAAPARRDLHITPRRAFGLIALVLALILIGLLIWLYLLLTGSGLVVFGGEEVAGIEPILAIEGPGVGPNPTFDRPLGVAFGEDDRIYVADTGNNRVCVFEDDGDFLFLFGGFGVLKPAAGVSPTWREGLFNFPVGIDADEEGNVYVADFENDQIQVFDAEGEFTTAFPDPFSPTGRGSSGTGGGIAVTDVDVRDGVVAATDAYQVVLLTTGGEFIGQFGKPGSEPGDLDHPNGIAIGDDGTVYVSDSNHHRVTAFTPEGEVVWTLGRTPEGMLDTGEREFGLPRGIAVTDEGELIVVDAFDFDLAVLSRDGEILSRHGQRGVELGELNFANDVDASGDRLIVADKENDRVQLLRLVR